MTIQSFQVLWVEYDMLCDKCGKDHMRPTGVTLTSNPAQYPHRCDHCGARKNFLVLYPHIKPTRGAPLYGTGGGFLTDEGGVSG